VSQQSWSQHISGNPYRIRDPLASSLIEIWLVSGVVTILAIRAYLAATGYPQVGGSTLHIAHMLWGGLGMLVAFGMLAIFAHPVWKPIATVVSGAGFGCFIDELGKFITKDNDYFYRPTVALIYAIFVILFLTARYFIRRREVTSADHLYLAVQGVQWAAIGKLDEHRRREALDHLAASGVSSPLVDHLHTILTSVEVVSEAQQSRILTLRDRMVNTYWRIIGNHWLERIVIWMFLLKGLAVLVPLVLFVFMHYTGDGLDFAEWGSVVASAAGGGLAVFGGVRLMQGRRVDALRAFAASVLCSLLVGQIFAFATDQFYAIVNVGIDLVMLGVVQLALAAEAERGSERRAAGSSAEAVPVGAGQVT